METSENFDKVMECLGVGYLTRKAGNVMKPNFIVKDLGDGRYQLKSESTFKTTESTFRIGEEFPETTPDGREVKSTITIEGGVMKQVQKGDKKDTFIDRVVEGNTLKTVILVYNLYFTLSCPILNLFTSLLDRES